MDEPRLSLGMCLAAAPETEELLVKRDALGEIPELLKKHFDFSAVCLIADENTYAAAGRRVQEILKAACLPMTEPCIFPGSPRLHAEYSHIPLLTARVRAMRGYEKIVPVSVGAGTVNDLVKRAASELALPYLCVPTAASVDGYTSYGAALMSDGFKQTFSCAAPRVLAADTAVLEAAPAFLSSSGFGDLAGKLIAGTDWIIAEEAGKLGAPGTEPVDRTAWTMTQAGLWETLEASAEAVRGDGAAVNTLFAALSITGFAMQYLRSSRPVSGCEHLWSHVWEMEDLSAGGVPVTHGHKVALGTLAATAFTEILFSHVEPPRSVAGWKRPSPREREAEVRAAFAHIGGHGAGGGKAAEAAVKTSLEKLLDEKAGGDLAEGFRDNWRKIRERVLEKLVPCGKLKALMARGGCPVSPEEINLSRDAVIAAARRAQMIRNRYTVLDMAWDMGVFEDVLAGMEADG